MEKVFKGRMPIYCDVEQVTAENIAEVMTYATQIHEVNSLDCEFLYKYYKGEQEIIGKTNPQREDINNIIIENRANEIVSFKTGYLMGEPIQYVSRGGSEEQTANINTLNTYCNFDSKANKDRELAEWFYICGTAYRLVLPTKDNSRIPVKTSVLNPANTFVVYKDDIEKEPILGVIKTRSGIAPLQQTKYYAYTDKMFFELDETFNIITSKPHLLGAIPIIEYPANHARTGAFEIVITILNAINRLQSDRLDAVDMFVQALLVIKNAQLEEGTTLDGIKKNGGLFLPKDAEVEYLTQELNQQQSQILADNMYQTVLTICGMPNRNGGTSTSDTGVAVIMRDGWSSAEARAKDQELMFKQSEQEMLKLMCNIITSYTGMEIDVADIDIRFTRRNYDNISEKSTVLATMLANNKIHPRLAFEYCGMFPDSDLAYTISQKYYDEQVKEGIKSLEEVEKVEVINE